MHFAYPSVYGATFGRALRLTRQRGAGDAITIARAVELGLPFDDHSQGTVHRHCFLNSAYDRNSKKWTCFERKHVDLVDKSALFKAPPHRRS